MVVTTLLTTALAILFVVLSLRVIETRRSQQVSLGSEGVPGLERRIRAQANLAEYAPFGIALTGLCELNGVWWWLIAIPAITFVVGRAMHGYALSFTDGSMRYRVLGMQLTFYALLAFVVLAPASVFL